MTSICRGVIGERLPRLRKGAIMAEEKKGVNGQVISVSEILLLHMVMRAPTVHS